MSAPWIDDVLENDEEFAAAPSDVTALANELESLKTELTQLEKTRKEAQARYDVIRKKLLPEAMQAAGMVGADGKGSFTLSSGSRISLRTSVYANYKKADEAHFFDYLRRSGNGDLIRETVHPQTLRAFARELLEDGEEVPPHLRVLTETAATLTRG